LSPQDEQKWGGNQARAVNFLNSIEKEIDAKRGGMTSWTKVSMTLFVDQTDLAKLARHPKVRLITENAQESFSQFFVASDTITTGESRSWGWSLTTNNTVLPASSSERRVYVIDSGVANHDDLNLMGQFNVACGTGVQNCSTGLSNDAYPVVGCYPHATHVAGIIGALGTNSKTSIGVYPGVKLVSLSVGTAVSDPTIQGRCSKGGSTTTAAIGYAFDWIKQTTLIRVKNGDPRVPIVNMSINPGRLGFDGTGTAETNRAGLLNLITPAYTCAPSSWGKKNCTYVNYPGVFFVQSAGNIGAGASNDATYDASGKNICTERTYAIQPNQKLSLAYQHAYPNDNTTNSNDGVMVVGGFHPDGRAASHLNSPNDRFTGIRTATGTTELIRDRFSNYGPCVDVWAPGNLIYSTWGDQIATNGANSVVGVTYSGNGNSSASGWVYLSGTSMAAPHIAGAAAYLADTLNLTSPASIETAVRNKTHSTNKSDFSGTDIRFVQIP
jgi:subtilisin family serine protease